MSDKEIAEEARRQIDAFLHKPKSIVGKTKHFLKDPMKYHTKYFLSHPDLSTIAAQYFCKMGASTASERAGSQFSYLTARQKNRLGSKQIDSRAVIKAALRGGIVTIDDIDSSSI